MSTIYNIKCKHLCVERDSNGEIAITTCAILSDEFSYEGNCGIEVCPLTGQVFKLRRNETEKSEDKWDGIILD